ncbi:hypothetical protein EZS27_029773 [termite gut metagenome]|uniref:Transposase DDE domain-containing protein n=1 Tax=termite gut metagenome TaxID=433724 RepID=A0A5J4QHR9_9ZZZZ
MSTLPTSRNKDTYKVRYWKAYHSSLCQRGGLTLYLEDSVLKEWKLCSRKKKQVGEHTYSDRIIQCCLLMKISYGLKFRQSTGFLESIFLLIKKSHLLVPDYSTLSPRQKSLPVEVSQRLECRKNLTVGIDSTGLKVYGEGEWKVRKHGSSKRRTWRKLPICMDLDTQEIVSIELTGNHEDDVAVGKRMSGGKTTHIKGFKGDGAYDDFGFGENLGAGIIQTIPPPKDAVIQKPKKNKPVPEFPIRRNEAVSQIQKQGSKVWKEQQGYHQESLNEVVRFRYQTIFSGELDVRTMDNQTTEVKLKCLLLTKFKRIGMPVSYKVQ